MPTPDRNYPFARNDVLPSFWANAIQRFIANAACNFRLTKLNDTTIRVPVGATNEDVPAIGIMGRWRWATANVDRTVSGGAGLYEVFAVAANNAVDNIPDPYTDHTNYVFDLRVVASGGVPSVSLGVVDIWRKVGQVRWDGTRITQVIQLIETTGMENAREVRSAGSSLIDTEEARTNVAFGTHTTPDIVRGIELVRPGLLAVAYRALIKESASGAGRAAIFVNGAQLQMFRGITNGTGLQQQAVPQAAYPYGSGAANTYWLLQTVPWGLISYGTSGGVPGAVLPADTVPVALGLANASGFPGFIWEENNANGKLEAIAGLADNGALQYATSGGGQVLIPLPAGVYDVDVRTKSTSGSVSLKQRKLYVEGRPF